MAILAAKCRAASDVKAPVGQPRCVVCRLLIYILDIYSWELHTKVMLIKLTFLPVHIVGCYHSGCVCLAYVSFLETRS